jgi:NADH-quinone oxidoreductase subunit L
MWLPDAMEGPTPVSALIHAATMVTAGIFVLIRSSFILVLVPGALSFMALVGGLTALFGASVACVQFDIKKVIAYSTCSQLGYMMFACGAGNFTGALSHLVNHAFFKAALSLGAGSVIHAVNNEQDMRRMGALANFLPITFGVMVVSSAASAGFPFLSGFYSKDYILEFPYAALSAPSVLSYIFGLFGAFGTSVYSFRLLYLVFLGAYQGPREAVSKIHESPVFMLVGMVLLVIPSVLFGYLFSDLFIGQSGAWLWESCIKNIPVSWIILPWVVRQAPFIFSIFGFVTASLDSVFRPSVFLRIFESPYGKCCYYFLARKWYFDDIFNFFVYEFMLVNFKYFWSYFEQGILIYFGPVGLSRLFATLSRFIDLWRVRVVLIYLKSIFYFLLFLAYAWFVETNFMEHIGYLFVIQVIGIVYYLTRLHGFEFRFMPVT